ncbi:TPA: cellulose synthase operon protein YhjQ/BcsQ [Escherichia coli]
MAVLGLQGVRGGVGTTTITAALAWSLQMLGENVLVVWGSDQFWAELVQPGRTSKPCVARGVVI